jgi:hypothetical protein
MADFSTILQDPTIRQLVQQGLLERAFHDALFPRMLFRGEVSVQAWPQNVGDFMAFTGAGLIPPKLMPLVPGADPSPSSYSDEQWTAQLQQYADSIDTHMPTSINAIASLFYRNAQQLGLSAAQGLNRIIRDRMYAAGLAGNTVTTAITSAATVIPVARLNGLTTARRPDLPAGSPVQFAAVSTSNPLPATIGGTACNIIGFSPATAGDQTGPGTITVDTAITAAARAAVITADASTIERPGGAATIDGLTTTNTLTLADIRSVVSGFWQNNVPEMPDGRFHCHLDPQSQAEVFGDSEFQRLLTALPDYFMYRQFALGELLGVVFYRNSENPLAQTVTTGPGLSYSQQDPFAGELQNASGVNIHRPIFVGQEAITEYYQDLGALVTEAGITGKVGESKITNSGIEVNTDRIQLIIRAPLNRLQDLVSTSWKFIGDWPVRTDVTTGDATRYKRLRVIEHG